MLNPLIGSLLGAVCAARLRCSMGHGPGSVSADGGRFGFGETYGRA